MKLDPELARYSRPIDVDVLLQALGARVRNDAAVVCCPAHEDDTPSLKITADEASPQGFLAHCFAGCQFSEVMFGLKQVVNDGGVRDGYRKRYAAVNLSVFEEYDPPERYYYSEGVYKAAGRRVLRLEDGSTQVIRERTKCWMRDGWPCSGAAEWFVPEGLDLASVEELRITASESDAQALWDAGWAAVSVPSGDSGPIPDPAWPDGAELWIVGDNDDSGRAWAARACQELGGAVTMPPDGTEDARDALEKGYESVSEWGDGSEPVEAPRGPWEPVNLGAWVDDPPPPQERFGPGEAAYRSAVHWLAGEPESGKSILMMLWALSELRAGNRAVILDEEAGPRDVFSKLTALGATREDLGRLVYLEPRGRNVLTEYERLHGLVRDVGATFVGIDGAAAHLAIADMDENGNGDVTKFISQVLLPIAHDPAADAAVVVLDHMTKVTNGNNRYARGAGAKLSAAEVGFFVENPEAFSKTNSGRMRMTCTKNRFGDYPRGTTWDISVDTSEGIRLGWRRMTPDEAAALVERAKGGPNAATAKKDAERIAGITAHRLKDPTVSDRQLRKLYCGDNWGTWTRIQGVLDAAGGGR